MTEQLYVKRFNLAEKVTAIWDDFYALGAQKEEIVSTINQGLYKTENEANFRAAELRERRKLLKLETSSLLDFAFAIGINSMPTAFLRSRVPPYDERGYGASDFSFSYEITPEFVEKN